MNIGTVIALIKSFITPVKSDLLWGKKQTENIGDYVGFFDYINYAVTNGLYENGYYVKVADGEIKTNDALALSDYIEIQKGANGIYTKFTPDGSIQTNNIAFYDESKVFISGVNGREQNAAIPSGAKYIRFNMFVAEISSGFNPEIHYMKGLLHDFSDIEKSKEQLSNLAQYDFIDPVIDNHEYTTGYYVKKSNGTLGQVDSFAVSDYIEIPSNIVSLRTKFYFNNSTQSNYFVFYDSSKAFIEGYGGGALESVAIPSNAKYIRFNMGVDEITSGIDASNHYLMAEKQKIPWLVSEYHTIEENHLSTSIVQNVIAKPFPFSGGNLTVFGDSIAAGYASNPLGPIVNPWIEQFCTKANATLIQKAIAGTTLATRTGRTDSIYERIHNYNGTAPNVIIIAGGTNDYGNDVPLGSYSDTGTTTVYGAMKNICTELSTSFSGIPVIFITPINRTIETEAQMAYFNGIRNAIYEIATKNGHSVIDGSRLGFPLSTGSYKTDILHDGLHPTVAGHKMYANAVCGLLL